MIYCLIVEERHSDVDVTLYQCPLMAVEMARRTAQEFAGLVYRDEIDEELTGEMTADGWLYQARWGSEGDCLRVVGKTIITARHPGQPA